MMRRPPSRQGLFGAFSQEALHGKPFGAHFAQPEVVGARARNDDEVDTVGEQAAPGSEALTAEALDPISLHGAPDAAGCDDAEARRGGLAGLRRHEEGEMGRSHTATQALCPDELGMLSEPSVSAKPERHRAAEGLRG
jgi:hypothetical protein